MIGVGDKVVYVDGEWPVYHVEWNLARGVAFPVRGNVYTVREIELEHDSSFIRLVEIVNPSLHYGDGFAEVAFDIASFRPVKKTKTDISIFQKIDREIFSKGKVSA